MSDNADRANRDPMTDAPGAHPMGVGLGAGAGGVAVGALAGTITGGPIGAALGAAIGAIAGGLGGKAIAEHFDPTVVDEYWQPRFESEPYHRAGSSYEDYAPAYRLGAQSRERFHPMEFDDVEIDLASTYDTVRGMSQLDWADARPAVKAAWYKVYHD